MLDLDEAAEVADLFGLAAVGALTKEAAELVRRVSGLSVTENTLGPLPPFDWEGQLAHQTGRLPSPDACLSRVRHAYAEALRW